MSYPSGPKMPPTPAPPLPQPTSNPAAFNSSACANAGFGPQKLAVLAAYSLRQSLLVWLKTYKADVELRQNIDPTVGFPAASRSNIERAAAAAIADTQTTGGFANPKASPFPPMDIMHETDAEGSVGDAHLETQRQSAASRSDPFMNGVNAASIGQSQNGRETDPLVGFGSLSSRFLQGPTFSSNAFPSFGANSPLDANSLPPQQMPASPFTSAGNADYASIPHSDSNLSVSSPTSPTGLPKPSRAPPPPQTALAPASPFISPFAQASQSSYVPSLCRDDSDVSIQSASSERERRPTVRFAETPTPDATIPATNSGRGYHHTDSGFTELAMSRGGSWVPSRAPTPQAPIPEAPGHKRSRSDVPQASRPTTQRSFSTNKSLCRHERAASVTLDALELPPLPLPAEDDASLGDAACPVVSQQPSRQMSLSMRTLSGFR